MPARTASRALAADAAALAASLEQLLPIVRRLAHTPGLSLTAVSTLRGLERHGPQRLSELATAHDVTQPAMTQLVTRLERDDLARRGGSAEDARVVLVSITDSGRELLRERREERAARLGALVESLSPADRSALIAAIPVLNRLADLGQSTEGSANP